jgi:hypothetical protein
LDPRRRGGFHRSGGEGNLGDVVASGKRSNPSRQLDMGMF